MRAVSIMIAMMALSSASCAAPLSLEATVPLSHVSGRIDHMAIDVARKRLFVAELGNGSVDVVDIASRKVVHRIAGLDEPQGIAYAPQSDRLVVACGGDGTVHIFDGESYVPRGSVKLDDDADNARLDAASGHAVVGHGSGGLAIIDPLKSIALGDVALPAHPEAFALTGNRAYVNVPEAGQIAVVDLETRKLLAKWTPARLSANFPMALDDDGHAASVFRGEDRFALFDLNSGRLVASIDTCGDADDVFFDRKLKRFYVSCGSGAVDVIAGDPRTLRSLGRIATSWGARTSLFVPELNLFIVAERAGLLGSNASLAIFRTSESGK